MYRGPPARSDSSPALTLPPPQHIQSRQSTLDTRIIRVVKFGAWFDSKYCHIVLFGPLSQAIETNKKTITSLPPAQQNRWLLVEFIPAPSPPSISAPHHAQHSAAMPFQDDLSSKDVFNALKQSVLLHFGDVGWGEVGASLAGKQSSCSFFLSVSFAHVLLLSESKMLFILQFWRVGG